MVNTMTYSNSIKQHLFAFILVAVSLVFQLAGTDIISMLRFERIAILSGQVWRLFSAHLVHLGWAHFMLNMAAFSIIWIFFRREWQQRFWVLIFTFIAVGISLSLLILQPTVDWAVGLSGTLHGLFVAGAIGALSRGYRPAIILLSFLILKLLWEQFKTMPGSEEWIGGTVITSAHLYGAVMGTIIALILLRFNGNRMQYN
jgi:rhomboid family GlyGly-CTERM serine protease